MSRLENTVIVDIFTIKPALVLGKDNENLVALEKKLSKIAKDTVKVNVKEIKKPDLVAKVV
ncbi:MAG: KH domain-containing protein [Patescibacteria group bacterium]|nr:KH domain-containing protein [Patescibacteria group bacterium]